MNPIAVTKHRFPWKRVVIALIVWVFAGVIATIALVSRAIARPEVAHIPISAVVYSVPGDGFAWSRTRHVHFDLYALWQHQGWYPRSTRWTVTVAGTAQTHGVVRPKATTLAQRNRALPSWWPEHRADYSDHPAMFVFGWPLRCIVWTNQQPWPTTANPGGGILDPRAPIYSPLPVLAAEVFDFGIPAESPDYVLPLELIANVALLGAVPGLLAYLVPTLRRRSRRSRGLCEHCGYSLEGIDSDRCPECGGAIEATRIALIASSSNGAKAGEA